LKQHKPWFCEDKTTCKPRVRLEDNVKLIS